MLSLPSCFTLYIRCTYQCILTLNHHRVIMLTVALNNDTLPTQKPLNRAQVSAEFGQACHPNRKRVLETETAFTRLQTCSDTVPEGRILSSYHAPFLLSSPLLSSPLPALSEHNQQHQTPNFFFSSHPPLVGSSLYFCNFLGIC